MGNSSLGSAETLSISSCL